MMENEQDLRLAAMMEYAEQLKAAMERHQKRLHAVYDQHDAELEHIEKVHAERLAAVEKKVQADRFLLGKVDEYRRSGFDRSLLEYLGMTGEEYGDWFTTGVVPDRVRRVWRLS